VTISYFASYLPVLSMVVQGGDNSVFSFITIFLWPRVNGDEVGIVYNISEFHNTDLMSHRYNM